MTPRALLIGIVILEGPTRFEIEMLYYRSVRLFVRVILTQNGQGQHFYLYYRSSLCCMSPHNMVSEVWSVTAITTPNSDVTVYQNTFEHFSTTF